MKQLIFQNKNFRLDSGEMSASRVVNQKQRSKLDPEPYCFTLAISVDTSLSSTRGTSYAISRAPCAPSRSVNAVSILLLVPLVSSFDTLNPDPQPLLHKLVITPDQLIPSGALSDHRHGSGRS